MDCPKSNGGDLLGLEKDLGAVNFQFRNDRIRHYAGNHTPSIIYFLSRNLAILGHCVIPWDGTGGFMFFDLGTRCPSVATVTKVQFAISLLIAKHFEHLKNAPM